MQAKNFMIYSLIFVLLAVSVAALDTGCCLNAYTSACRSLPLTEEQCCPSDNLLYYGPEGAPDEGSCETEFFVPNTKCVDVPLCRIGCCCNPDWARAPTVECLGGVWTNFTDMTQDCNDGWCSQFDLVPPEDKLPEELHCGGFSEYPWVKALPMKGEKSIGLIFGSNCTYPPKSFTIKRKKGLGDFQTLETGWTGTNYIDDSPELEWGVTYTYEITATYVLKGNEKRTFATPVNFALGDTVCWGVYDEVDFCISDDYFKIQSPDRPPFVAYFRDTLGVPESNLDNYLAANFGSYYNNGYYCDSSNLAAEAKDCSESNKACVLTGKGLQCYVKEDCTGVNPFGLFTTEKEQCQNATNGDPKYCFFDKSTTVVGKCYQCDPMMDCYDYKTEETCENNHCWANGQMPCVWSYTNQELGIGVCKAIGKDNCKYCGSVGTEAVGSSRAHNYVFNRCTQQKLDALQVAGYPCGTETDPECKDLICEGVTAPAQCAEIIQLGPDNSVSGSSLCEDTVKVCKWQQSRMTCVKDANGDGQADCSVTNVSCQRDRYPPRTELVSYAQLTPKEDLSFRIYDKTDNDGMEPSRKLEEGYTLYFCSYLEGEPECGQGGYNGKDDYHELNNLSISVKKLIENGILNFSTNYIKFFAVDKNKNVEIVKTDRIVVSANVKDGLGVEFSRPGNNSYVNKTNVVFSVYVVSYIGKVSKIYLKNPSNGEIVETLYSGEEEEFTASKLITLSEPDGPKRFIIETHAGNPNQGGTVRETPIVVHLDRAKPARPILKEIVKRLDQNFVLVNGTAEPGTRLEIYISLNDENSFERVKSVWLDESTEPKIEFLETLFLIEGDYWLKARAIDKAGNTGPFSTPIQNFTFVKSAPGFVVDPPHGAVRAVVKNSTVYFYLRAASVGVDTSKTKIAIYNSQSEDILGVVEWFPGNLVGVFKPDPSELPLQVGVYSVLVHVVDEAGNIGEEISQFEIGLVPRIRTSLTKPSFKTREQFLQVTGSVDGGVYKVVKAHYFTDIKGEVWLRNTIEFPFSNLFTFDKIITLVEGYNSVYFYADNEMGGTALEPYEIIMDQTPPAYPKIGLK